jgi:HK97 family phage prohead protease
MEKRMIEQRNRQDLLNVREQRSVAEGFKYREKRGLGNELKEIILEGYAATFEPYDVHGGPDLGGWVEQLDKRAFETTLASSPDLQLLINHEGTPLARTKSGTLKLSVDNHGLLVWASLDPSDPDVQRLMPKMRRGDMDEMSFAFRVTDQSWDSSYTQRTIVSLSLQKGDVSVVNYGMNPGTKAILSADAVSALAALSNKELVELRKAGALDIEQIRRARQALSALEGRDDGDKPYGNVAYADPGYKDGKKRYPIDTKDHAKAAWSYINMPKNQKGYTAQQVSSIKSRIQAALKKFGVDTGGDKKSVEPADVAIHHVEQTRAQDGSILAIAVLTDGSRVPLPQIIPASVPATQSERGFPPSDMPAPDSGKHQSATSNLPAPLSPSTEPGDPHNEPFDATTADESEAPALGPVPANILGSPSTSFDPPEATWTLPTYVDPHSVPAPRQTLGAPALSRGTGDVIKEEDPFKGDSKGDPFKSKPMKGADAPNIVGGGKGTDMATPKRDDMDEMDDDNDEDDRAHDHSGDGPCPECDEDDSRANDDGDYDPETGEGRVTDRCDETDADNPDDDKIDLSLAAALDRTIVHAYKLAEGNPDLRKLLSKARTQLDNMRNIKNDSPSSDVARKMQELRMETGQDCEGGNVSDYLKALRSEGSAPVGYRGLLAQDPSLRMRVASDRLADFKKEQSGK